MSGYEVWNVTDVTNPQLVGAMRGLRNTHKQWWECNTGIAFMPGSKDLPVGNPARWRQGQSMVIADWSDADVWRYVHEHDLPYHPLHDQGYASIGCAPCTLPGNGREGRWAGQEKTECGLHV